MAIASRALGPSPSGAAPPAQPLGRSPSGATRHLPTSGEEVKAIAKPNPGILVLLRHGESTWNLENLFTGWTDVPLSDRGVQEAVDAGRLMKEARLRPGVVHESLLLRAIQTTQLALAQMGMSWGPVKRSWRLNERHYGALPGLNKKQTAHHYRGGKVKPPRRRYHVPAPLLQP